ncbi:MAG: hypothetical protein IJU05_09215 [Schwartzia sp.]|nr:hypothetical protein [Schwartzia sp. (in: firmicutes)]
MGFRRAFAGLIVGLMISSFAPFASAAAVEVVGEKTFLYMDTTEVELADGVRAVDKKDGSLAIVDKDGKLKLGFRNVDDAKEFVGFTVRELAVEDEEDIRFWEILADVGAHAKNCGYWLISEEKGNWRFAVTTDDLAKIGYKPNEWHVLQSEVEDGRCILTASIEYMPEGAQFEYERQFATDWQGELVWSERTRSFLMRPLPLE